MSMNIQKMTVKEVVDVATVHQPKGIELQIVKRRCYALSFSTGGKITYSHNGKTYFSDTNHVIFHPKNESYILTCQKTGDFPLVEFELTDSVFNEFIEFEISSPQPFIQLLNQMKINLLHPNKTAKNLSILYEIFDLLSPYTDSYQNSILTPAINKIHSNFNDSELTIETLASLSHVSECYFRKKFHQAFGISPKKYINNQRIKYAMQLLKESNKTITEIADACGFSNVYYFSKTFKEHLSVTPTEYAKHNTKKGI